MLASNDTANDGALIIPALMTGTRLGQFAGHEKMDRQERLAADDVPK